ncbi:ammonium transporter [Desulfosporosinus meridiei]|uniref:Ammonium transporter n=1 Tax=Desulfosporosinus meridiei (strain ATCC BAA-275 / DSM 13257 / KCTC 12902 / NCIMB 13706 / S10) TaxID=768704 RepID=J7IVQ1_DESMD|nr:ammonium transporter [Desulfosporosinus meridiei]AFQ45902.1 ammonium transporter [Desulfosporosinus meridiei DSM 13257]
MKTRFRKNGIFLGIFTALLLAIPGIALGAEPSVESNAVAIDTIWTLIAGFLVFFMQAGFAMVEAGFTRAKNAGNIIMKNLMDFSIGSLIYWLFGFAIMFGVDQAGLFGTTGFGMSDSFEHLGLSIPLPAFLLFQTVFAATAATIVSGAMAERTKFMSYIVYSFVISAVIYPVVGHWIWGGGWLMERGMIDFAGSTVVHSVGGWAALIGALLIGPRVGKYSKDGKSHAIPGHNITLGALGVFILWFGWFGFNPGSTLSGTNPDIGKIALNTNLAAAAGATMTMFFTWIKYKKPDVSLTLNGALAGLVAITAGCLAVDPIGAAIIGAFAGILIVLSVEFIDQFLKIDDPVGAISVHGVCGSFGTVLVGLFAVDGGLIYGGGTALLITQIIGVASVFAWTAVTSLILFGIIKATLGLRVSEEEEIRGLDIGEHGMEAYSGFEMKAPSVNI